MWQVSEDLNFHEESILLSQEIPFQRTFEFNSTEENFLNFNQSYYFRAKTNTTDWSASCSFSLDGNHIYSLNMRTTGKEVQEKNTYAYNSCVSPTDWTFLEPFFLPYHHPLRSKLDRLFTKNRVIQTKETFEKSGFEKIKLRQPTNIVVGKHPLLKGYLIKTYLDSQPVLIDWHNWMARIRGAQEIREKIKRCRLQHCVVPQKWIYPLPEHPSPPNSPLYYRKNFLLIVEDMNLVSPQQNLERYKKDISKEQLKELFVLFSELGLIDSVYPDNIPFTRSGKIAFVDTEHYHRWPVQYEKLKSFLNSPMQNYWQTLIDQDPK
jgi:hypothetical protein